jgi:hypothetical protein
MSALNQLATMASSEQIRILEDAAKTGLSDFIVSPQYKERGSWIEPHLTNSMCDLDPAFFALQMSQS